jgi:hypothetical protein
MLSQYKKSRTAFDAIRTVKKQGTAYFFFTHN